MATCFHDFPVLSSIHFACLFSEELLSFFNLVRFTTFKSIMVHNSSGKKQEIQNRSKVTNLKKEKNNFSFFSLMKLLIS